MLQIEVKLAKTIFGLKNNCRKWYSEARKGGLAMPLTSQNPSPPFHMSPSGQCRSGRGEAPAETPLLKIQNRISESSINSINLI